jgi:adenylate cyclase
MMNRENRELFEIADLRAERTVAALRIGMATALAVVLLLIMASSELAREPAAAQIMFYGALTIAAYFALGVFSAWIAQTSVYKTWISAVFATANVAFVIVNLIIGTASVGLPPELAAAFPAAWLIPVVLAFGGLRSNPFLQAYVTVLLVAALSFLLLAPIGKFGIGSLLESITLLFAPATNFARLSMIALTGAIMAVAAGRSRRLVAEALHAARRNANLTRHLPHQIAARLADSTVEALRRGERRTTAVMFVDIRAFTGRAETMTPTALGAFLTEFRRRVTAAAEPHDGIIDKFIGDGVMVVFGVVHSSHADARDAIACGRTVLGAIDCWNAKLKQRGERPVEIGIGAHIGEVFCGAVGDESRLEFTILGDTVNVASRLQEESKAAGFAFIASEQLLAIANCGYAGWTSLPERCLRGRGQTINLYGRND